MEGCHRAGGEGDDKIKREGVTDGRRESWQRRTGRARGDRGEAVF